MRISVWSSDVCSSDLELRFLDVDDAAGFCERHHEVGLSCEKSRELQNVDDFGDWRGLPGFVHVGDPRYAELGLHGLETPQAFFEAGARSAERREGEACGCTFRSRWRTAAKKQKN